MKTIGIQVSILPAIGFMVLGKIRNQDFYLAALGSGFIFFRLVTGSACPLVWLTSKFGVKGLTCPADNKK
jgi:hypothetical protein